MGNHKEVFQLGGSPHFKVSVFDFTLGALLHDVNFLGHKWGGATSSPFSEHTLTMSRIRQDKARTSVSKRWLILEFPMLEKKNYG